MQVNKLTLMIGGEAGAGISRSGFLFAKTCQRGNLNVFGTIDYQSLIRGGHNFYTVTIAPNKVYSQTKNIDLLIAFNKETILLHKDELVSAAGIIYDPEKSKISERDLEKNDIKHFTVPLGKIVKKLQGPSLMENTVALGATIALLDYELDLLFKIIRETFKPKIAEKNIKAAQMGFDYVKKNYSDNFGYKIKKIVTTSNNQIFISGNEAIALGAINAGCKFYAAYPMTPATSILHFLVNLEQHYKIMVVQTESEIAAINMVAGASYAGVRSMTATSGGGFCLMTEGLGMIGMTETSPVIVLVQRSGPSTGLPTYSAQADLSFAIHASHGEFPRVIIAPGDFEEAFYLTMEAFNIADKFQIPVIIISDKYLAESSGTVDFFDLKKISIDRGDLITKIKNIKENYKRYKFSNTGISSRVKPGTKNAIVRVNADEHNEFGFTTEDPIITTKMTNKRFKKMESLSKELDKNEIVKLYGKKDAKVTILGWGSTKGPILGALKVLADEGIDVNYLQILYLHPFPKNKVKKILQSAKKTIIVENNKTSQLSNLIQEYLLKIPDNKILKYDGRPFNPKSLSERIKEGL